MKLVRFGERGAERPGLVDASGTVRDLSQHVRDLTGDELGPAALARLAALPTNLLEAAPRGVRTGACVGAVSKFVCVGLNYRDHVRESKLELPREPVLFMKAPSCITGANDGIVVPPGATMVDWEIELGVVIGSTARSVPEKDALRNVAGYCIVNDVSERGWQLHGTGQWMKGKSADSFGPLGPWLVTADEVPDPQRLRLWLSVNGGMRQDSNTSEMIFPVAALISYISRFMTLCPGDVVSTGTPAGVGLGLNPPNYLKPGDVVTCGIDGLGEQKSPVLAG
jgi:2-keto-4-pentenoate hydratase/2-oxohepta-3-ene-1,7-dioic acid hydratase in catechol pathway